MVSRGDILHTNALVVLLTVWKGDIVTPTQWLGALKRWTRGARPALQLHLVDVPIVHSDQHAVFICCVRQAAPRAAFPPFGTRVTRQGHARREPGRAHLDSLAPNGLAPWAERRVLGGPIVRQSRRLTATSPRARHTWAGGRLLYSWEETCCSPKNCTRTFSVDYKESWKSRGALRYYHCYYCHHRHYYYYC